MNNLEKNINLAKEFGLFEHSNSNKNQTFDCYGNYYFPTDYSNCEENTILSLAQILNSEITKSNG